MGIWKKRCCCAVCCLLMVCTAACAPQETAAAGQLAPETSGSAQEPSQPQQADTAAAVPRLDTAPLLGDRGDACGTDGKPACPLVKPVENLTKQYDRTPEQTARMEAFDQLTLEEKFIALDQGLIVCTEFIHDETWEHEIAQALIDHVGEDKYRQWMETAGGCHSIYDFANAFLLTYEDVVQVIRSNGLERMYPLDALKAGMEKWAET